MDKLFLALRSTVYPHRDMIGMVSFAHGGQPFKTGQEALLTRFFTIDRDLCAAPTRPYRRRVGGDAFALARLAVDVNLAACCGVVDKFGVKRHAGA